MPNLVKRFTLEIVDLNGVSKSSFPICFSTMVPKVCEVEYPKDGSALKIELSSKTPYVLTSLETPKLHHNVMCLVSNVFQILLLV